MERNRLSHDRVQDDSSDPIPRKLRAILHTERTRRLLSTASSVTSSTIPKKLEEKSIDLIVLTENIKFVLQLDKFSLTEQKSEKQRRSSKVFCLFSETIFQRVLDIRLDESFQLFLRCFYLMISFYCLKS